MTKIEEESEFEQPMVPEIWLWLFMRFELPFRLYFKRELA